MVLFARTGFRASRPFFQSHDWCSGSYIRSLSLRASTYRIRTSTQQSLLKLTCVSAVTCHIIRLLILGDELVRASPCCPCIVPIQMSIFFVLMGCIVVRFHCFAVSVLPTGNHVAFVVFHVRTACWGNELGCLEYSLAFNRCQIGMWNVSVRNCLLITTSPWADCVL